MSPTSTTTTPTDQTALTQLLNAAIASANPDPLTTPLGVYWGHPLSYASGTHTAGNREAVELFRSDRQPIQISGSHSGVAAEGFLQVTPITAAATISPPP